MYPQVVDDPAKSLVNKPFLSRPMLDDIVMGQRRPAAGAAC